MCKADKTLELSSATDLFRSQMAVNPSRRDLAASTWCSDPA